LYVLVQLRHAGIDLIERYIPVRGRAPGGLEIKRTKLVRTGICREIPTALTFLSLSKSSSGCGFDLIFTFFVRNTHGEIVSGDGWDA
jgi:hypothetical protein